MRVLCVSVDNRKLHYSFCPDPQARVHRGRFPRIFGVSVHAYLVYLDDFSTHIWRISTHIWCTERLQHIDSEQDARPPVYLYGIPVWIACSSSVHCGNCFREAPRREPPPPAGERRLRRSAHDSRNMRCRRKDQHAVVFDLKAQRGIDTANAPEGIERLCAETSPALRSFGIPGAETPA
jgi:hypothetical protein